MRIFTRLLFLVASFGLCHANANPAGFEVKVASFNFAFVVDEPVDVVISIRNLTGQPLKTAAGDSFTCTLERRNTRGNAVARYADARLPELDIQPNATWHGQIRLTDIFKMRAEGDYFLRFKVANRLGEGVSDGTIVSVVSGVPVKSVRQMFADGTQREFRLVYLQNYQVSEYLYLRIIDPAGVHAWDTIALGPVFRKEEPKLDIRDNNGVTTVTTIHRIDRDRHYKVTLESTPDAVRIVDDETLFDPEAIARERLKPFLDKALEPPPPPKPWYKFW